MKYCNLCKTALPLDAFGINRAAKDGHNAYCLKCNRERTTQYRILVRRTSVLSNSERVMKAVRSGHHTRDAIRRSAKLRMDDALESLAELSLVQRVLIGKRMNDDVYFFERAA